ncbi:D(4) dopamine receptor-like isoform X2 [Phyllopteryx taeniolatus]|uniref:D(4) dopamine receptor-like isoform X2 n=1 Tax=Phyllopteryx taeniolatus TaxID=161469 RepID=UPI002AD3322C|nr:D(4) dopamine receptor-like isoform X2 [Phyllopteryx taeniolatus]
MVSTVANVDVKQKDPEQALVVAISCSAVLEDTDDGEVHGVGVAFPLLQAMQNANRRLVAANSAESLLFDVLLVTTDGRRRQSARIVSSTKHHGLEVSRFCFSGREDFVESLLENRVQLFLSAEPEEASQAWQRGVLSALLGRQTWSSSSEQLRVLLCGGDIITTPANPTPAAQGHNVAALVLGVLLIVVIVGGNALVCVSVLTEKALKTTTNYFIVSLAVSDLLLAVLVLPLFVYSEFQDGVWTLSTGVCDGLMSMDVMLCTASIFNLCAISVDRFIAVLIPLNYNRKHVDMRQSVLLSATWVLALAVASPVMLGVNEVAGRRPGECKLENADYVLYSSVCSFFIPCPVMLLLYCGMFRGLRRWEEARKAKLRSSIQACRKLREANAAAAASLPPLAGLPPLLPPVIEREADAGPTASFAQMKFTPEPRRRSRAKINSRERKAMKVLPVVVGVFLLCWTPFFVLHIVRARCRTCDIPPAAMSVATWLGYVNSALNPVIYTVFNAEFRRFFKNFLRRCCHLCCRAT